jgi:hypothetical protein
MEWNRIAQCPKSTGIPQKLSLNREVQLTQWRICPHKSAPESQELTRKIAEGCIVHGSQRARAGRKAAGLSRSDLRVGQGKHELAAIAASPDHNVGSL